jgi:hypothetical protein
VTRLGEFLPIGRLFNLDSSFEKFRSSLNFWDNFVHGASYAMILTKNALGYILGDFFANSSGHPAHRAVHTSEEAMHAAEQNGFR